MTNGDRPGFRWVLYGVAAGVACMAALAAVIVVGVVGGAL